MKFNLRQARPDEAEFLTALAMRSKQSNGYDDAFMEQCRDELTVTVQSLLAAEFWVAQAPVQTEVQAEVNADTNSGTVCGCVGLSIDETGNSGEVHSFFVDPDWKRKGIGRLLWQDLMDRATSNGIKQLRLDADPSAVAFYEAQGFNTVSYTPSGSIAGRTLPHMTITLG